MQSPLLLPVSSNPNRLSLQRWQLPLWFLLFVLPVATSQEIRYEPNILLEISDLHLTSKQTPASSRISKQMQDSRSLGQALRGNARKIAGSPTLTPASSKGTKESEKIPTSSPISVSAPTPKLETASVPASKPVLKPTSESTSEPTSEPTSKPTSEPTSKPLEPESNAEPTTTNVDPANSQPNAEPENHSCDQTQECNQCQVFATDLKKTDPSWTCVWSASEKKCSVEQSGTTTKPIECSKNIEKTTNSTFSGDEYDDGLTPLQMFGAAALAFVVISTICRKCMRAGNAAPIESPGLGKYQGVTTLSDDDNEWGWDDNPKPSVEMSSFGGHAANATDSSARYRRGTSPHNSFDSGPPSPNSKHKGLSVKKSGMNNPLSSTVKATQGKPVSHSVRPSAVKKLVVPKPDDFFAEMGLESKPTFPTSTSNIRGNSAVKRLGATSLPSDDWGDDDLDDLLDD